MGKTVLLIMILVVLVPAVVFAEGVKDKYKKLQDEINIHKEKIEHSKKKELSVIEELEKADRELNRISYQVEKEKAQVAELEESIKTVKHDMAKTEKTIAVLRVSLKKRLQAIQRYGYEVDRMVVLLNVDSFYEMLRTTRYLSKMSGSEYRQMESYKDLSSKLSEKEKKLQTLASQLRTKAEKLKGSETALVEKKKEREQILLSVRKEQALYGSMLKELESTSTRLKDFLEKNENEMSDAGKEFKNLKGALSWPIKGRVAIPYGTHQDPQFKTPVYRNGIYISSENDSSVRAVYDGKVVFADMFKGLGQVIILSHGMGYHTVYANLSSMFAKAGDIVKARSAIGNAGTSSLLNTAGMYFEIRYKGKPINPLQWLKREN
ncbi:murein hydrolase activator EnvC family protein [Candidatus Magnetobacterium casense]|uniref:Peptidoglycan DD-metalloendopeptidase family protein n=1 Tax=Candidatus Magnetobacterium casense TaxID=1455061 RepID=A0ABS6RYP8_9BACT|nr:peptidoglycan DD-metalloendopeptidase family protein [Candidatus Magnetobacterium casensis]MBV6341772.1 peptidoglycan DD-metalloendopeptidase family protein [Candidatus Magnetobacterium casensis]